MNVVNVATITLLNGFFSQMRQRAMWHRGEGAMPAKSPWSAINMYEDLERVIRANGFDPARTDVFEMIVRNTDSRSRANIIRAFRAILDSISQSLEYEELLHAERKRQTH